MEKKNVPRKFPKIKGGGAKYTNKRMDAPKLLRGVEFKISKNGLDFYPMAMERLELYTSTM